MGRVRAVPPAQGNSLVGDCNPPGVPRLYYEPEPVEFIQAPGRMLQYFSWTRALREVWTDGRKFPEDVDALMPTWYGYNIGRWEGDELSSILLVTMTDPGSIISAIHTAPTCECRKDSNVPVRIPLKWCSRSMILRFTRRHGLRRKIRSSASIRKS